MANPATELEPEVAKWVAGFVGLPYEMIVSNGHSPETGTGDAADGSPGAPPINNVVADAPGGGGSPKPPAHGGHTAAHGAKAKAQPPKKNDTPELVLTGRIVDNPFNPDDPFSETPAMPMVDLRPPLPMPLKRPSNNEIISKLQLIPEFMGNHASDYLMKVKDACEKFQQYAEKEIDDFAEEKKRAFEGGDVIVKLVGVVATVALGSIGGEAIEGVGKLLADAVKDAVKDTIKEQVAHKVDKGDDIKSRVAALKRAIQGITNEAEHKAEKVKKKVVDAAKTATDPLIHKLREGKKLEKNEDAFVLPYFTADSGDLSRLYEDLGMPGEQAVKSAKLNTFAHLCLEFQKELQVAEKKETLDWLEGEHLEGDDNHNLHVDQQIEIVKDEAEKQAKGKALKAYKEYQKFEES